MNVGTGRFFSVDPFPGYKNFPRTLHKYTYAGSNPINSNDPSGYAEASTIGTVATFIPAGVLDTISLYGPILAEDAAIELGSNVAADTVALTAEAELPGFLVFIEENAPLVSAVGAGTAFLAGVIVQQLTSPTPIPTPTPAPAPPTTQPNNNNCNGRDQQSVGSHCVGHYNDVGGHHPHQQAARTNNSSYDAGEAMAVRDGTFDHRAVSRAQVQLHTNFRRLRARTGAAYTLQVEEDIQRTAMMAGGFTAPEINQILQISRDELRRQGALNPTRVPGDRR